MQITRRNILKSMMIASALATHGLPRMSFAAAPTVAPHDLLLLTAGTDGAARRFALGVQADVSFSIGNGLPDPALLQRLFMKARGKRLLGLMPDAAYVLFSELARDAGLAQMFEGRHMVATDAGNTRHALQAVPGFHGAGSTLAATLAPGNADFAITETPLGAAEPALRGSDWSSLGFASYRVARAFPPDEIWLHLSGLGIGPGCAALGLDMRHAKPLRCHRSMAAPDRVAGFSWEQTLGHTLAELAAGIGINRAPCVKQAFLHRLAPQCTATACDSLVSFVMQA